MRRSLALLGEFVSENTGSSQKRTWRSDPWLPETATLEPDDYRGANGALQKDRGHQAPPVAYTGTNDWQDVPSV